MSYRDLTPFGARNRMIGLTASSEYQALHAITNDLCVRLSSYGYVTQIVDLSAPEGMQELAETLALGDTAFAFGYAGIGSQLNKGEVNLWTASRIPFAALWFDHPAYNYRQHIVSSPYVLHIYHVRDHFEARRKYLPAAGGGMMLLPAAGGGALEAVSEPPWKERERKILFAKTADDPRRIEQKWQGYPPKLRDLLNALAEQGRKDRNLDLADATAALFRRDGHPLEDLDNFFGVMQEVDHYIRAWRSDRLAGALLPHEAKIVGDGWDYLKDQPRRAEFLPPIPSRQFLAAVNRHRIVANASPLWRDGIHERAQMAIGCGNIALTDRTEKADKFFGKLPNYAAFDWNDDLGDVIAMALKAAESGEDYFAESDKALRTILAFGMETFIRPFEGALQELMARAG